MAAMNTGWLVALGLTMIPSAPAAQPPPPQQSPAAAATARALVKAAETAARLAVLPHPEFHESDVVDDLRPEPREAELDRTLHRQVGDFVEAWLAEHGADAAADQLRDEMTEELWWGPPLPPGDDADDGSVRCALDGEVRLTVVRPDDDPGLLAVSWRTQLGYLDNTTVHVFTIGGGRVERVLEWSAELAGWPEGDSPGTLPLPFGATDVLDNFDFRLTARDERGDFYLAAAWSEPSPASSWGAVSWAVLANGSDPRAPRVLARGSDGARECYDDCYRLGLAGDEVLLDYNGSAGGLAICGGYTSQDVQRVWRLADGGAEELTVPAAEPFHFVSDWLDAPWREARRWSARGAGMRRWHRLLRNVACQLERGPQWIDAAEPARREVLELVLVGTEGEGDSRQEWRLSLFFVFGVAPTKQLLDIAPRMPAGEWLLVRGSDADESDVPPDEP